MTNMIQNAKDQVAQLVAASYARAMEKGLLGTAQGKIRGSVEVPKDSRNGDYTSNFALAGAKALGMRPPGSGTDSVRPSGLERLLF